MGRGNQYIQLVKVLYCNPSVRKYHLFYIDPLKILCEMCPWELDHSSVLLLMSNNNVYFPVLKMLKVLPHSANFALTLKLITYP